MAELGAPTGAMASIGAGRREVEWLLNGAEVTIACINSPRQTIISGERAAVAAVVARAQTRGLNAVNLPVSHAFHSPLVAAAVPVLAGCLAHETFRPLQRAVVSTVTGTLLPVDAQIAPVLCQQVTAPVRFTEAINVAADQVDLWIEVGPGRVLSGLVAEAINAPVVALDAGGPSLAGLLGALGAAFALGASVKPNVLFADRFVRPFTLDWQPSFFVNPCELAPTLEAAGAYYHVPPAAQDEPGDRSALITAMPQEETAGSPLALFRQLVADRLEMPLAAVNPNDHLLSDLHLNSISVSQLVVDAARRLRLPPPVAPTDFANATVGEVAQALEQLIRTSSTQAQPVQERVPAGVAAWVQPFTVELIERARSHARTDALGLWQVIAPPDYPLAEPLRQAFVRCGVGGGTVVCVLPGYDEHQIRDLLAGAHTALSARDQHTFVLVQHGRGAAPVARTLYLEATDLNVCVVDVPLDHPAAPEWVVAEAVAVEGYVEAYYSSTGVRHEPVLRLLPPSTASLDLPLGSDDLLLVTGGGKGITAECAIAIAQDTGAQLVLLGRSTPGSDAELAANIERIKALGLRAHYVAVDITDAAAVQATIGAIEARLGTITGILHGAARNVPCLLRNLDEATFQSTLATKIGGLRNILAALDPSQLHMLVTFGSIIARTGLPGEADYGLANERLAQLTAQFQAEHPACRCLCIEWSIWSEVGMGARMGSIEALKRGGIMPIPPDEGVAMLRRLLSQPLATSAVVVTGRYGGLPTLSVEQPELPFLRFLDRARVFYPGVELVVETDLSSANDPYLEDHVFHSERLLPGIIGLEAMAQVAMALVGSDLPPVFEAVQFNHPVAVPKHSSVTIRLAALVREPGCVEVVLRSEETAFQQDYFRAICRFGTSAAASAVLATGDLPPVVLDPRRELYGTLFFQGPRFQRLQGYQQIAALGCVAEIGGDDHGDWFGRYLPQTLVLGDPGARDATIHAIQVCVPDIALLPVSIDRFVPAAVDAPGPWQMSARERLRDGTTFVYDVEVYNVHGVLRERWEGLRLRAVSGESFQHPWVAPLLGPYIERRVQDLAATAAITVVVERAPYADRRIQSDQAIQRVLGKAVVVHRRPDGKPEVIGERQVSVAHAGDLTVAIAAPEAVGCDLEPVMQRGDELWQALLGPDRFTLAELIRQQTGEDLASAATRLWTAAESLKKAGVPTDAPLLLYRSSPDGWVQLSCGPLVVATLSVAVDGNPTPLVLAVACASHDYALVSKPSAESKEVAALVS